MIHSENGRVVMSGNTPEKVDDLTFAMAAVLSTAKCKERKRLMTIGLNIVNNAVDILEEHEREEGAEDE